MNRKEIIDLFNSSKPFHKIEVYFKSKKRIIDIAVLGKRPYYFYKGDSNYFNELLKKYKIEIININYLTLNQKIKMLEYKNLNARIEEGAFIRDYVEIKKNAVILMGAIINVGAKIGENTMIDMGAVIGSNAIIKNNCHIGANAVISGVLEPESKKEVIIEDDVFIGANAVISEGVHIGRGAIIGALSFVNKDVLPYTFVCGSPAKKIKDVDDLKKQAVEIDLALRK